MLTVLVNLNSFSSAYKIQAGARCNCVIERPLLVVWIVGSISHGGPTELVLVPASAPRLVQQRAWCVLACLGDSP